jgi:hypothetical protein
LFFRAFPFSTVASLFSRSNLFSGERLISFVDAVEAPDGPEFAEFHVPRHSYLTLGRRAGTDLRTLP